MQKPPTRKKRDLVRGFEGLWPPRAPLAESKASGFLGLGARVSRDLGFRLGIGFSDLGFRLGIGFRAQGSGFRL